MARFDIARRAASWSATTVAGALTPERTRKASFFERRTVGRLSWAQLRRLNQVLEIVGRLATTLLVAFGLSALLGYDWRQSAEDVLNSGRPVQGALAAAIVFVVLGVVALRSVIGFGRWRIQRELWRREVAELQAGATRPR